MFQSTIILCNHSKCGTLSKLTSYFKPLNNSNNSMKRFPSFGCYFFLILLLPSKRLELGDLPVSGSDILPPCPFSSSVEHC